MMMEIVWNRAGPIPKHIAGMRIVCIDISDPQQHVHPRWGNPQHDAWDIETSLICDNLFQWMACSGTQSVRIHKLMVDFVHILVQPLDIMPHSMRSIKPKIDTDKEYGNFTKCPYHRVIHSHFIITHSSPFHGGYQKEYNG